MFQILDPSMCLIVANKHRLWSKLTQVDPKKIIILD